MQRWCHPLLLVWVLAACSNTDNSHGAKDSAASPPPEVDVIVTTAEKAIFTEELQGRLTAVRSAQVRARVEGIVDKQLFLDGAEVKQGAPLFRLDPRSYQASLAAAEAELANQRNLVERYLPLLASKAVSAQEMDAARAKAKAADAALTKARLDLENALPVAPISGRAGRALVTEGALVGKTEATHLVTIEQLDPIRVEFTQPHSEMLALKKRLQTGRQKAMQTAELELFQEDGTPYPHRGHIKFNDLAVDPATGAIAMRAEFPNPRHDLLPGTFVRLKVPTAEADKAVRVPQRAVQTSAEGQQVLLVDKDGKVSAQPITTDGMVGTDFIIATGLSGGEQIIVNGLQKVRPGGTVKPVPWQATPAIK